MQPGVILKKAGLLPLKGYLTFLTKTNRIVFIYSYTGYVSMLFWRHVRISQQCAYSNADILTTIQDSCMEFSAFVQHSLMYRIYVKTEKHIMFVINAGFLMTRHKCNFKFDLLFCQNNPLKLYYRWTRAFNHTP